MYLKGLCDGLTSEENVFGRQNRFDIKVVSGQGIRLSQCETIGGFNRARALVIPVFFSDLYGLEVIDCRMLPELKPINPTNYEFGKEILLIGKF